MPMSHVYVLAVFVYRISVCYCVQSDAVYKRLQKSQLGIQHAEPPLHVLGTKALLFYILSLTNFHWPKVLKSTQTQKNFPIPIEVFNSTRLSHHKKLGKLQGWHLSTRVHSHLPGMEHMHACIEGEHKCSCVDKTCVHSF